MRLRRKKQSESYSTSDWNWQDETPADPVRALQILPEMRGQSFGPIFELDSITHRGTPKKWISIGAARLARIRIVALSDHVNDIIKITAGNPADYVRRAVDAWGTLEKAGALFHKNRSTILRWLRKGDFSL